MSRHIVRYDLGSVQSVPRVMRGVPAPRGSLVDVPLSKRDLAGLESQGIARTLRGLGSLGSEIEMPEECVRPGEVLLSPGVCGPVPQPINPYATPPQLVSTGSKLQYAPAASSARSGAMAMSRTTMLLAAVAGIGLVYYLSKKR